MVQILPQINTIIYTKKLLGGDYMKDMVKISNLNQTFYTKDGELEVLKNINFNLMEGQILTILGPSGSGKSTILNILTNLLKPTSGDVIINGKIGYMFQKDNLLEWRNIMDNITTVSYTHLPELKNERYIDLLFLKIENSRDNYPKEVRQLIFKVRRRIETSFLN